eukprot:6654425-Pyramimonas_sp.AAC.1
MTCKATVFACVKCGAWAQQRQKLKLREQCTWPTVKDWESSRTCAKALAPEAVGTADRCKSALSSRREHRGLRPERVVTKVARPAPGGQYEFEQRMAMLQERMRAEEQAAKQGKEDANTMLGNSGIMANATT